MPGEVDRIRARIAKREQQIRKQEERERRRRAAAEAEQRAKDAEAASEVAGLDHPVKVGQVWASNHKGDRETNMRQHREVVAVRTRYGVTHAEIRTGDQLRTTRVQCTSKSIKGHRLVQEAPRG